MLFAKGAFRFILLLSFWTNVHSGFAQTQNDTFYISRIQELFDVAQKTNDSTQLGKYLRVERLIEDYLDVRHNDPQALYYLAYTKSRINSADARGLLNMSKEKVLEVSEILERLNQVEPHYEGKIISQDPYSKLSSEWGALALKYLYFQQDDSARWAFQQAKERGGYREYILSINRSILETCPQGSVLFCSGDLYTLPLHYLQKVENYRTDVRVMDLNLLNTQWYPHILTQNTGIRFGLDPAEMDSITYCEWTDSVWTINGFSWEVPPSLKDRYLLRGDRLLLRFLQEDQFRTALSFTGGMNTRSQVGLNKYLEHYLFQDMFFSGQQAVSHGAYMESLQQFVNMSRQQDYLTRDEHYVLDGIRERAYQYLQSLIEQNELSKAKDVHTMLTNELSIKDYPPIMPSSSAFIKSVQLLFQNALESNKN